MNTLQATGLRSQAARDRRHVAINILLTLLAVGLAYASMALYRWDQARIVASESRP